LDRRIDSRVDEMLQAGLVEELLQFRRQYNKQQLCDGAWVKTFTCCLDHVGALGSMLYVACCHRCSVKIAEPVEVLFCDVNPGWHRQPCVKWWNNHVLSGGTGSSCGMQHLDGIRGHVSTCLQSIHICWQWHNFVPYLFPAGFHCHLVGKTLRNVCYSNVTEIRFVNRLVSTFIRQNRQKTISRLTNKTDGQTV